MFPITRPNTPRTELYNAVSNSNQISFYPNINQAVNSNPLFQKDPFKIVKETKEKFPDFDAKMAELTDRYNPETLSKSLLYNSKGEELSLETNYNEGVFRQNFETGEQEFYENVSTTYAEFTDAGIPDTQADRIMDDAEKILTQQDKYNNFREWQKGALEVFTIDGMTGREMSLNGQEGVRVKKPLPKHALVDIWGGVTVKRSSPISHAIRNISKNFKKYQFPATLYPDGNNIDGRSIAMKMNSSARQPEKDNIKIIRVPYKTSDNQNIFISLLLAKRDIQETEELRYNYYVY